MKAISRLTISLCFMLPLSVLAQSNSFEPGTYITGKGWGSLTVKPARGAAQSFEISSIGSNAHTCTLEGEIRNGKAKLDSGDSSKPCVVSFTLKGSDIDVDSKTMDACRTFCGVRAGFAGLYFKPSATCMPQAQKQARKKFKNLYNKKAYTEARTTLEPLLTECGKTQHWLEDAWIRNDMAVTLHKLGDFASCQAILQPLAADATLSDEELRGKYPPADAEAYSGAVKAARTNLRLCKTRGK